MSSVNNLVITDTADLNPRSNSIAHPARATCRVL
jgi:hypothetical protein